MNNDERDQGIAREVADKFAKADEASTDSNFVAISDYYFYPILAALRRSRVQPGADIPGAPRHYGSGATKYCRRQPKRLASRA